MFLTKRLIEGTIKYSLTNNKILKAYSTVMVKQGPRPLVICGPSGSGKSTLLKQLFKELPETFGFSVSHTTRKPRPGEENGVHYHFVSIEEMQAAIERGDFLEHATFSGNMYGTSKQSVRNVQNMGKVCVLDIEIEGVKQIRNSDLNPILVFIYPPSLQELENRLRNRKTETEESLQKRLKTAKTEMEYGKVPGNFHIVIHNYELTMAYQALRDFVLKELETQRDEERNASITPVIRYIELSEKDK
ncbi:guanylate kinase isoform X1 [Bradysia coprophila]|uniref:guanylate kinase isoform X1 n=2 Tax=Bradysia coprophila TaxID=38358 RepID=UPI00187DA048|nr:guanylate kinase isoform X1 [Bradysia coprophila]